MTCTPDMPSIFASTSATAGPMSGFTSVIQFARPAWFIKTTARNKEALANNAEVRWLPEHIGTGRFGDFLPHATYAQLDDNGGRQSSWTLGLNYQAAPTVVVNPEIKVVDPELEEGWEGCLSIPGLRGMVPRHRRIKIKGRTIAGEPLSFTADGFHARVIQHEFDHLDGVVFLDRMT